MKVIPFSILALCVGAAAFNRFGLRNRRSASDESFEEELEEGYQMLKDEPNADDTKRLVQQLHDMEEEIKDELIQPLEHDAEVISEMKTYIGNDFDRPIGDSIEEVNRQSKVDTALYQGDIILTKEQAEEVLEGIKENEGDRKKRQAYRDDKYPKTLWSDGVYYSFAWNTTSEAKRVFRKAVQIWTSETCIDFHESYSAPDRIVVLKHIGCWSHLGKIGGEQGLSLGKGCDKIRSATHELGHALGFYHTHSRHDRDDFITLDVENFRKGWISQFVKQTEATNNNYNLTYDYGSIMHYGARGVSRNGEPAVIPRDVKYTQTLGSPMISFYEKLMMNLHYNCLENCTASNSAKCENGGFPHPRNCSECICPSGYGGRLCNERPSGCGATLTATSEYQKFEDTVGNRSWRGVQDDYTTCTYWIQAPIGSKIEIVLDKYLGRVITEGCQYMGVEIKTGSDQRHTGYRFCTLNDVGTTLVSASNFVPIITYTYYYYTIAAFRYRIAPSVPETSETTHQPVTVETTQPVTVETTQPVTVETTQPVTVETTHQPTTPEVTLQTTTGPNAGCTDADVCPELLKTNFCNATEYDDEFKKVMCPKSCRFC